MVQEFRESMTASKMLGYSYKNDAYLHSNKDFPSC